MMRLAYPRSFFTLLLIGFLLTFMPLLLSFINAAVSIHSIDAQSRKTVQHAVKATQSSLTMIEQVTLMERSVRLYLILGDRALLDNFASAHRKFGDTTAEIRLLPMDVHQKQHFAAIIERERAISQTLGRGHVDATAAKAAARELAELYQESQAFLTESNQRIDREISDLRNTAEETRKTMLWQALVLTPAVLLIALVITVLIVRPLRAIDSAIQQLGRGQLGSPIRISGPDDLRKLGQRLDWLRRQMLEMEEEKNRFLRRVSHDLKTPLTAIREGAELLSEEVTGKLSDAQREITEIMRLNSLRLQKLIESLLSYSAAHFQSTPLQTAAVDLRALIEAVINDHTLEISSKQIKLAPSLGEASLQGDKTKLAAIFDNLLSNAIKFSPPGGTIAIELANIKERAIVDIRDDGPGIAPEDRERLFEPFYMGSAPQQGHVKGSGLGLSIAREFVFAHNGLIDVIEDTGRNGAHFRVTLPLTSSKGEST